MAKVPPRSIRDVLDYYNEAVIPALAAALIYDNVFPEAVLNEIRNALTHLGRANAAKTGSEENLDDLNAAYRHLKRVCLDCFKLSVVKAAIKVERTMILLEEEFNLPEGVHTDYQKLQKERVDLQINEGIKTPDEEVVLRYKTLFDAYDNFAVKLGVDFGSKASNERATLKRKRLAGLKRKEIYIGLFLGVLGSLIASFLFEFIMDTISSLIL